MDLEAFLGSKYDSDTFESFIKERFYGLDIYDSGYTDDFLSESEKKSIDAYRFLGKSELDDGKEIGFFEFKSKNTNIENKRVGYNEILRKLAYEEYLDGAIASFYHPDGTVWRLSFVGFEYDEGKANVTNLRRYTYVLGKDIPIKTPYQQLKDLKYPSLNEIEEAFSVEAVTKDFYLEYKALFEKINEELEPQKALFIKHESDPDAGIRKFSRKLLGRITFMYFLQKKGWLGVTHKWGDGRKDFLSYHFQQCESNFYEDILSPLFFTALNTQRENDYYAKLDCKIPFLNGGLFTKERFDHADVILSDELFGAIFDTFNQYNFTIIEDLPHDSEVAIDPEMLGRVFENLIEENYRKGKGAFYTPREIVHYMCKQSIIMYLSNHFDKESMENLINDQVTDDSYIKKHATQIKEKLLQMKVLDPAIGSGAFPMGILHEMVQVIGNLNKADNPSKEKKLIIENSIYGVDIDGSAVDIAKLRFWLSIIVDEEEPFPLPNLAFKIMQGNSLIETIDGFSPIPEDIYEQKQTTPISLFEEEHTLFDETKFDLLRNNIHTFYNASDTNKKQSLGKKIKEQIQEIVCGYIDINEEELKNRIKDFDAGVGVAKKMKLLDEMERLENTITKARNVIGDILTNNFQTTELFLYKLWFGEVIKEGGFDLVIGNPPYLRVQGIDRDISEEYKKLYKSATGSYDLYVLFVEKALSLLSGNGILNYIMPHKWINASFGKGLRELTGANMSKLISFDAYRVFNASTYTSLLWLSKRKNKEFAYVELNKDLQTNIELEKYLNNLDTSDYAYIKNSELTSEAWTLTNRKTYEVLKKIKEQPLSIKDIFKYTSQGVVTTGNDVFYLEGRFENDTFIGFSKALNTEVTLEKDIVKPILLGKDIRRYDSLHNKYFVVYPHHLVDKKTKPFSENFLKNHYPLTYNYLLNFKNELRAKKIKYKNNSDDWFSLTRPREIEIYEQTKLITPQLALGGYFTYDSNNIYIDAGCYSFIKHNEIKESYKFYLSILNSKVCWFFIKNTSAVFSGGYFYYKPIYLNHFKFPKIKHIENSKPFEILVDYIMWLKAHSENVDNYVDNKYIAKLFEDVIDAMVLELYFEEEMNEARFAFIDHAKELFSSIEDLSDSQMKDIIYNAYQSLREKDNSIRNDLQLLPIRVPIVAPILESI